MGLTRAGRRGLWLGGGLALLLIGGGVAWTLARREGPRRYPALAAGAPAKAREDLLAIVSGKATARLKGPMPLRAKEARALVLTAAHRYQIESGVNVEWSATFGSFAGDYYTAPDAPEYGRDLPRLYDLILGRTSKGATLTLLVRIVPDRQPMRAPVPVLKADAEFSAAPPRPVRLGNIMQNVAPRPLNVAGETGIVGGDLPDLRPLTKMASAFPILVEGPTREERGFFIRPSDPHEAPATCRVGPLTLPPELPAKGGGRLAVQSARVAFAQWTPEVRLTVPHPASAFLKSRLGLAWEPLPPRRYDAAVTMWTGLVLTDVWNPAGGTWRYAGTLVQTGNAAGQKSGSPEVARAFGLPQDTPADGSVAGWSPGNDLIAVGRVVP